MNVNIVPNIKKFDEVWTADSRKLGLAHKVFERQGGADPDLQLYSAYMQVENFEFGYSYYIPTDFIAIKEAGSDVVRLTVTFDEVIQNTWFRLPDFVARAKAQEVELAVPV